MIRIRNFIFMSLILSSCSFLKSSNNDLDLSIRFIGNLHLLYEQGIQMTRGIYVTNDKDLDQKWSVISYDFIIHRDSEKIMEFDNLGEYYSKEIKEYISNNLEFKDSISIENVRAKFEKTSTNAGYFSYIHLMR